MLYKHCEDLKKGLQPRWVFIADEPDIFKSITCIAHKKAFALVNNEGGPCRAYGLTATLVGNRLSEAYGIFRVIMPSLMPNYRVFENMFCVKYRNRIRGYKNLDSFKSIVSDHFFGRLQDDPKVEQELPEVITKDIPVVCSVDQSWKIVEAFERLIETVEGSVKRLLPLPSITYAKLMTNDPRLKGFPEQGAKVKALQDLVTGTLKGKRVIIFCFFKMMILNLKEDFKKIGIDSLKITGDENILQKKRVVERFMSDGDDHVPILFMNKAGSKALNLQSAGHVVFFDLPWGYDLYRQVIGRVKRTGSLHSKIGVFRFLAELHPEVEKEFKSKRTMDHFTLDIILRKFELWKSLTGDNKTMDSGEGDIEEIFNDIISSYKREVQNEF
jgi:SNF2 family DNA or RNA helicase